jgi:CheY-like chemotaxis protein
MHSGSRHPPVGSTQHPGDALALRVLVIDDSVDHAELVCIFLESLGYKVWTALDGMAGLELARTCRPNVVLLDIGLPQMDGYEVAVRLRALPETSKSLLVALTGYDREEARRRSQEAGFDLHLTKPLSFEELESLLSRHRKYSSEMARNSSSGVAMQAEAAPGEGRDPQS